MSSKFYYVSKVILVGRIGLSWYIDMRQKYLLRTSIIATRLVRLLQTVILSRVVSLSPVPTCRRTSRRLAPTSLWRQTAMSRGCRWWYSEVRVPSMLNISRSTNKTVRCCSRHGPTTGFRSVKLLAVFQHVVYDDDDDDDTHRLHSAEHCINLLILPRVLDVFY